MLLAVAVRLEAATPPIESTGFEAADGWVTGFVCGPPFFSCANINENCEVGDPNPDTGWYLARTAQSCSEPHIDTVHAQTGTQHLRFTQDPALCQGLADDCTLTAYTPDLGSQVIGPTTVSFDVASGAAGSLLRHQAHNRGSQTTEVELVAGATIRIIDMRDFTVSDTGVPVALEGVYKNFRIELDPCGNRADYYYDSVLIHTTALGFAATVSRHAFLTNNGPGSWDVDNFSVVRGAQCPPATCGNDTIEFGETCDGTDDFFCPGRCAEDCTCIPLGTCCDTATATCTEGVIASECTAAGGLFRTGATCCTTDCRAAGAAYDSLGVELLSQIPLSGFVGPPAAGSDIWGYVSPAGREYAIIGLENSTAFVDITDPFNPVLIDQVFGPDCAWRDIRTRGTYAYIVNDCADGMPIVDLGDIDNGTITLVKRFTGSGFAHAHNIALNLDSGFAYFAGSNLAGGGLVGVDLADPENPVLAGAWTEHYVHDTFVTTYSVGPYAGREIAFNFDPGSGVDIVDVTDKISMTTLATITYPNVGGTHQGWLTQDKRYVIFGDESDEPYFGLNTTTYIADVTDLEEPQLVDIFSNGGCATDHNLMIRGGFTYLAAYTMGLRVYDTSDVANITEVAYFDTNPDSNAVDFFGAWGVYTELPSGIILVSDRLRGLFVLNYDCNGNGIDDTVDIAATSSDDANDNGLPDECEVCSNLPNGCATCSNLPTPTLPVNDVAKSRYLSIVPGNGGVETALRITLANLDGFPGSNGQSLWVGPPRQYPEEDLSMPELTFTGASLQCDPYFQDWGTVDVLQVFGGDIVPGSDYQVHAVHVDCADVIGTGWDFGAPLDARTGKWGDVAPLYDGDDPGAPQPDFNDIAAVVAKFTADPNAPIKALAQLQPNTVIPSRQVDFKDIAAGVAAFVGTAYFDMPGFTGPCACPSTVTCRAAACVNDLACPGGFCIDDFCTDACGRCTP